MIFIERSQVAAPAVLSEQGGRGLVEADKAKKSLRDWKKDPKLWKFKFAVYSDQQVKDALGELFYNKCAYCESSYGPTQPMDVEHWRPKAQVETLQGKEKPAYYWLASTWDNLLPSCIDCNRRRTQKDALTGEKVLAGKEDQFPLDDGSARATAPGQEGSEVPLLLNPCVDDPATFLAFTDKGVVKPADVDGPASRKARASVTTYALNRSLLVLARKEHLSRIQLAIVKIVKYVQALEESPTPGMRAMLEELLLLELSELARMRRADQPYAQQARQIIDAWVKELQNGHIPMGALETPPVPGRAQ
jgi:uncharacterized protein (TIGR02646 family)